MLLPVKSIRLFGKSYVGRSMACLWVLLLCMMPVVNCEGHLLNMTTVQLDIVDKHQFSMTYQIDLNAEFGDRKAYYFASQLDYPLQNDAILKRLDRLSQSVVIQLDGQAVTNLNWHYDLFEPEKLSLTRYLDPMTWPSTKIHAHVSLSKALNYNRISVQFTPVFLFEEPISLTINNGNQRMTRWLINMQTSPEFILDPIKQAPEQPKFDLSKQVNYFYLGFKHILPDGYDHLLFIFLIVLLATNLQQSIVQLSLFTIAHSITLVISFFKLVALQSLYVELLIASSVLYLAIETLKSQKKTRMRYYMIFSFGLIHGLGFASALAEQTLPQYGVALSLLLFNLGIEAAQIMTALFSAVLTITLKKMGIPNRHSDQFFASVSVSLAIFWIFNLVL